MKALKVHSKINSCTHLVYCVFSWKINVVPATFESNAANKEEIPLNKHQQLYHCVMSHVASLAEAPGEVVLNIQMSLIFALQPQLQSGKF